MRTNLRTTHRTTAAIASLLVIAIAAPVHAQSEASEASAASLVVASELPAASLELLRDGARFSVAALRPVGASVQVVLVASAEGGEFVLELSGDAIAGAGLSVGAAITASATGAGWLLHAGGRAIAFVPSHAAAALMHRRELTR